MGARIQVMKPSVSYNETLDPNPKHQGRWLTTDTVGNKGHFKNQD